VNWDEVEYLQKIEVFERLSSRSRSLGWLKGITMKSPVILSNKAGDAAIYAHLKKIDSTELGRRESQLREINLR
jgi:hypothetical protein